jgi:AcrR family transcriptional regulator
MARPSATTQRATPATAFTLAQATVRAGERLDMAQLATELGVARATLYRWTGDRNRLLGDVLWTEVAAVLEHVRATAPGGGVTRLELGAGMFLDVVAGNPMLVSFLKLEGDSGLRLVTAPAGPVRPRIIAAVARMIEEERDTGRYRPPAPAWLLADGIVSLGERFLYHAGDRELNPDPETAKRVIGLLLREA